MESRFNEGNEQENSYVRRLEQEYPNPPGKLEVDTADMGLRDRMIELTDSYVSMQNMNSEEEIENNLVHGFAIDILADPTSKGEFDYAAAADHRRGKSLLDGFLPGSRKEVSKEEQNAKIEYSARKAFANVKEALDL